ncbi:hypothetical protein [Humibacter ginsenosidimutans]|uniref:Uncharacterized protein n=1 Tax=Humibacter ginsenosidimutans TaxID=2599293 RepID=A0A5B8M1Y0_9MICO|nr:hypothetical protein [Humibacter ginsenosidimutans]QDZ14051.1 hypothetical protein FPZ11_04005 [Humibacter ginsenosidimutans]
MLIEGTLRWRVTEDCPWDLLMALCLRDLAGLEGVGEPPLPAVVPAVQHQPAAERMLAIAPPRPWGDHARETAHPTQPTLADEWVGWWRRAVVDMNSVASWSTSFVPPHFAAFDRELALQDLVIERFADAVAWSNARRAEYLADDLRHRAEYSADIVDTVRQHEHELHRQTGSFRLDIEALPLAEKGAWVVGPDTVVVSWSLRDDHEAFRAWFTPIVAALV